MAIDTEDKRRSASSVLPFLVTPPVPDGEIDTTDRRHIAGFYRMETQVIKKLFWCQRIDREGTWTQTPDSSTSFQGRETVTSTWTPVKDVSEQ